VDRPVKYSIVIVTYNSETDIGICLSAIQKSTRNHEIIVIDNASRDKTREAIAGFPGIKTIFNSENRGFSAATNQGIMASTGEYIVLLNPDTAVFPLWADRMAEKFQRISNVGAVGPLSTNCIGYQSVFVHFKDHDFNNDTGFRAIAEKVMLCQGKHFETNLLIGFCLMFKREVIDHVGLLDERLFLGNDDLDLSWRLRLHGYKLIVAQDAFIAHEMQKSFKTEKKETTEKLVQKSTDALYRKLVRYYGKKNLPTAEQLWGIPWFKPSDKVQAEKIPGPETKLKIILVPPADKEDGLAKLASGLAAQCTIVENGPADAMICFNTLEPGLPERLAAAQVPVIAVFSHAAVDFPLHIKLIDHCNHCVFTDFHYFSYARSLGYRHISFMRLPVVDEVVAGNETLDIVCPGVYADYLCSARGVVMRKLLLLSSIYKISFSPEAVTAARWIVDTPADTGHGLSRFALEAMGQGKLVFTYQDNSSSPAPGLIAGEHFVAFNTPDDLEKKLSYYTSHADEVRAISSAGHKAAWAHFTVDNGVFRICALVREVISPQSPICAEPRKISASSLPFIRACANDFGKAVLAVEKAGLSCDESSEKMALATVRLNDPATAVSVLRTIDKGLSKAGSYSLGLLLREKGEHASAKRYFEQTLETRLASLTDLCWVLPAGMPYERTIYLKSVLMKTSGTSEANALDNGDRALNACALYHLAYIALGENNLPGARKYAQAMQGMGAVNDLMRVLSALVSFQSSDREGAARHCGMVFESNPLGRSAGLALGSICMSFDNKESAWQALIHGIDALQLICLANGPAAGDYTSQLNEYRKALADCGANPPEPKPFFTLAPTAPVRRYADLFTQESPDEIDLNTLEEPEEALIHKKGLGRSIAVSFRNIQSLECMHELTSGTFSSFSPLIGERVREYTFVTAENLLSRCGYDITSIAAHPLDETAKRGITDELVRAGRLVLKRLEYTADEWERFFVRSYTITAVPRTFKTVSAKKVSIVMLTFNQLSYTKQCIESINACTDTPFEIIVVDNGSTDATPAWLSECETKGLVKKAILNKENRGVAAGWNQGMRATDGDYILIMNNDVVVSRGWLIAMLQCAESNPAIGMVGPMTNSISGLQLERAANYTSLGEFHSYAREYLERNAGNWWEIFRIVGFCMLIKKEIAAVVGDFDERFGLGNFEDDDYCLRIRRAGYRIMVAGDSFIHHFGSVSFSNSPVDWSEQMLKNQRLFNEKWASLDRETIEKRTTSKAGTLIEEAGRLVGSGSYREAIPLYLAALEKEPANALGYEGLGIVAFYLNNLSDAEKFFIEALRHAPNHVDAAFNLADVYERTGRTDKMREVLSDVLRKDPDNREARQRLARISTDKPASTHGALFAAGLVKEAEECIARGDYDSAINQLAIVIENNRDDHRAFNGMGLCAWYKGKIEEAYWFFKKAVTINPVFEDALINFSDAAMVVGRTEEVISLFEQALERDPSLKTIAKNLEKIRIEYRKNETAFNFTKVIAARELNSKGEAFINEGLVDKAEAVFRDILGPDPGNFVAINNLGVVCWYRGDLNQAVSYFKQALALSPTYEDALVNIFDVALKQRTIPAIIPLLESALRQNPSLCDAREILHQIQLRRDRIYEIRYYGQIDGSLGLNQEGKQLLEALKLNEATLKFLDAIEKNGDNSDSYCGLGIIQFYRAEYEDAFKLFTRAVELNPLSQDALLNLYDAALRIGYAEVVRPRLQNALDIDPSLADIKRILEEGITPEKL